MRIKRETEIECPICHKKALKCAAEVKRQYSRGRKVYCSPICSRIGSKRSNVDYIKYEKSCPVCDNIFVTSNAKKAPKFCCQKCANNYTRRFVDYKKTSIGMKQAWKDGKFDDLVRHKFPLKIGFKRYRKTYNLICCICHNSFGHINNKIQTCGKKCSHQLMSQKAKANPNCGGETNYKKYQYKGIWMDCSWEVKLAEFLDSQNIEWIRSRKIMFFWTDKDGSKRRYYPDFYLPKYNLYLDPKNKFLIGKDTYKINQVIRENGIELIWGLLDDVLIKLKERILNGVVA